MKDPDHRLPREAGFTLIELMVTTAIMIILATVALPLAQVSVQRRKEAELRQDLYEMRNAIDRYKAAADRNQIQVQADTDGYPPSLETLVDGVPLAGKPGVCELAEAVEARIRGRNARAAAAGQVRYTQQVESLARVGRRAELAGRFSTAARSIERVPVEHRPRAAGLRAQLRTLAAKAAEARSDDALDDLEHLGEPVVTEAQALRQVLDEAAAVDKLRRRQQADEQKRAAEQRRRIERSDKVAADQHRRAAAAAEKAREKRARDLRGLLARKTTRPGEDVLGRLVALDVVRRVDRAERVDTRNGWDRLTGQAPRWMRRPIVGYETVEGSWHRAEALASWQAPAVRAALQEALAVLDRPAPVLSQAQAALLPAPAIRAAPASGAPPGTAAALYGRLRP